MRRKYFTSNYTMPSVVFLLITSLNIHAKKQDKDTEIICFAAQKKWVCAPADQQDLANEKAQKLLGEKKSEAGDSNVIIKSINIPKFDSYDNSYNKIFKPVETEKKQYIAKETIAVKQKPSLPNNSIKTIKENDNPYAKLWSHQLIGLSTPNSAIKFVQQNNLNKEEVLIIKSTRANMDWWIVLFGLYTNKQVGLDNEVNLPNNIKDAWLRPLKNLKVNGFIEKY